MLNMNNLKNIIFLSILLFVLSFKAMSSSLTDLSGQNTDSILLLPAAHSKVVIYTPVGEVYDDGVFRKLYSGFRIYDTENNLLLRVSTSIDQPVQLRMETGEYLVRTDTNNKAVYRLVVEQGKTNEFTVPDFHVTFHTELIPPN